MTKKQINYEEAIAELEVIIADVEEGKSGIDKLTEQVKRASELIEFCRNKLYKTEKDIDKILDKLDQEED